MKKNFWKSIKVTPLLVGASLLAATQAQANEIAQANVDTQIINQLDSYSAEGSAASSQDQVTSVSQLRDVSPTDWAFEALRSLVERYGCIVGYPDRTFRGNRALSRYEFAAGLNACMQQMERLIASSEAVMKEDIDKLKRLISEFETELAALGARVDNLEGRVAFLEDHQFSTTTKLKGEVILGLTNEFNNDNQVVFNDRVRLSLNTSFTGEDTLITRLAAGNASAFNVNGPSRTINGTFNGFTSSPTLNQTFDLSPNASGSGANKVVLDWLAYYAPIKLGENNELKLYVAGTGGIHSDYAPTTNPFFEDYDGGNGALSTFASENPIFRIGGGAGAALSYRLGFLESLLGPSSLTVGYLAGGSPNSPLSGDGLFNGSYSLLAQLNFNISDTFGLGFTYVNAYNNKGTPIFGGVVGTSQANNPNFSSNTNVFGDLETNSFGTQAAWRITHGISLSGFFSYTDVNGTGGGSDEIWSYGGGVAFPDLFKEGSVLGIFAGVQPYSGSVQGSSNADLPLHVEAFYRYQLTDNISLTPGIVWVNSPNQVSNTGALIGTLRTTFTF